MSQEEIYLPDVLRRIGLPATDEIAEALLAFEGIKSTITPQDLLTLAQDARVKTIEAHVRFLNETLADRIAVGLATVALGNLPGQKFSAEVTELLATPGVDRAQLASTLLQVIATEDFATHLRERKDNS